MFADAAASPIPEGRWIDLSHAYGPAMADWPTARPFRLSTWVGETARGHYIAANDFAASEHCGTHMDAPAHIRADGRSVDQIRPDEIIGPAVVVDVSEAALVDRDYAITREDLARWEANEGPIPESTIVLFNTGSGRLWPDAKRFLGTDKRGEEGVGELCFPGLGPEAARWLVEHRRPRAIGIDVPSIDRARSLMGSDSLAAHDVILGSDIPILENVANLDQLPPRNVFIVALPMKIEGGTAGPVREPGQGSGVNAPVPG